MIQRVNLPGHFELFAIDGVVPTFDVDAAFEAGEAQLADDTRPVAVAEARRAHLHERDLAEYAVLADNVPAHGRVLAVDVKDFRRPLAYLRNRVDEVDELVAGLPFEPDIV